MKVAQITLNALPKLYIKIHKIEKIPLVIRECSKFERYWLGYGLHQERSVNKIDRFIMVRNPLTLMTRYYFWTGPRRGEEISVVRQFQFRIELNAQFVDDHFSSHPISRGLLKRHGLTRPRISRSDGD